MGTIDRNQIIIDSARTGLGILQKVGDHMPAGHNGPWNDPDTPLRNTSHWLITFIEAYEITGDNEFKRAAQDCLEYLLEDDRRPDGYTFKHRSSEDKDKCNGLIGQAWTIEALACAANHLDSDEAFEVATDVISIHQFNYERGLWEYIETDGTNLGVHGTINQHIYFTAAAALLQDTHSKIRRRITRFLDKLNDNIRTRQNGLIIHRGYESVTQSNIKKRVKRHLRKYRRNDNTLEYGYHSFNLYALSLLKMRFPKHDVWESDLINKALNFTTNENYKNNVSGNVYSFGYNPTGIELAFTFQQFGEKGEIGFWLKRQFQAYYDSEMGLLCNGWDNVTLAARIYELTRMPNCEIPLDYTHNNID